MSFNVELKLTGRTPWGSKNQIGRAGVILIHEDVKGEISFLMIKHLHSQVWSKVVENCESLSRTDWSNFNRNELQILSQLTLENFQELSIKHCAKYDYDIQKSRCKYCSIRTLKNWIHTTRKQARRSLSNNSRPNRERWTFPKGCQLVDSEGLATETLEETAVRELYEETGIVIDVNELGDNTAKINDRGNPVTLWLVNADQLHLPKLTESNDEVEVCQWMSLNAKLDKVVSGRDKKIIAAITPYICSTSPYIKSKIYISVRGRDINSSEIRSSISSSLPTRKPVRTSNSFSLLSV